MNMTTDTTYTGWTNYATWRVNLEIFDGWDTDVEWVSAATVEEMANEILEVGGGHRVTLDFARAFISDVNWEEIAEHLSENQEVA